MIANLLSIPVVGRLIRPSASHATHDNWGIFGRDMSKYAHSRLFGQREVYLIPLTVLYACHKLVQDNRWRVEKLVCLRCTMHVNRPVSVSVVVRGGHWKLRSLPVVG